MLNWKGFVASYRVWRRSWFYPLISVVVALSLCLSTPLPGRTLDFLPLILQGVQVLQLSNISDRQETDIGKQINQQILGGQVKLYRNAEVNRYVEQIGRRLAANSDRPNLPFTFQVVEDDAINAFATLGGYVYVHTGLLKTADNEAELASVIAHEIGHIGGKHLVKQMRQKAVASGLATATGLDRNTAVNIGVELALNRPRSRQDEFDADQRGLRTLTRAGYAQSGMVSFMQKLLKKGGSTPTFLSTHPGTSDRIEGLRRAINSQPSNANYGLDNASYKANIRPLVRS
ncbi:M48 family metallopeptidase [Nostoc sp. UCD121]|uniref:M48 family metallopeptidase n=1 Tax=unclassified Nostoc TaxID=2593658 RepID=UPI000DECC2CF|nr:MULTISPECIES: M48 family metalloprotease [unclassified Nostoc]MBC1294180.1 M48 family metallopeptidase [Nostoc sp. UCD122]MBC1225089.1 M48 family metallopeptidase [Nostoc sp. UCD120]MBC1276778.1 M48 family metallopeptidase [Nostoc sp. UCD121]QHG16718.1 M48 family metalloprotease [Nostoc sp. ATCC 53789]RCJ19406.1 peptidase [Nostoc sp. ATCC 53789]